MFSLYIEVNILTTFTNVRKINQGCVMKDLFTQIVENTLGLVAYVFVFERIDKK